jgi:hypothetical protein
MSARLEQASMIEPIDPLECGVFDVIEGALVT